MNAVQLISQFDDFRDLEKSVSNLTTERLSDSMIGKVFRNG